MDDEEFVEQNLSYEELVEETIQFVEEAAVIEARVEALAHSIRMRRD